MTFVLLSGGKSRRMGYPKAELQIGSTTLLESLMSQLPDGSSVVIVGEQPAFPTTARIIREEPAFSGPVAAVAAGVTLIETPWTAVIAVDMPHAVRVIRRLEGAVTDEFDAVAAVDSQGFIQGLSAIYRTEKLRQALSHVGEIAGASMKSLLALLHTHVVALPDQLLIDLDTPEDLLRFNERIP